MVVENKKFINGVEEMSDLKEMKGCYLLRAEQPPDDDNDWPDYKDPYQLIFVYATDNEFIEFMSLPTAAIKANVKYDDEGNKIFDVNRYNKIDVARTIFSNKTKRAEKYEDVRYLFDGDEFRKLFTSSASVEGIYMQCQIAQHCRWVGEENPAEASPEYMYAECLKAMLEFEQANNKYPGYDEKFKMPTPEDIEQMKKDLGIKNEG